MDALNPLSRRVLAGGLAAVFALAACSSGEADSPSSADTETGAAVESDTVAFQQVAVQDSVDVPAVVKATRKLGLGILAAAPEDTMVTSPASAVVALGMLGSGAVGEAEDQFELVLGAPDSARDRAINALMGSLTDYEAPLDRFDLEDLPEEPQIHLANQVVLAPTATVETAYLDQLKEWYDAGVLVTDLSTEAGLEPLSAWVKENTAGLIEETAVRPSPDLRLVLQNATLFASRWQEPFRASLTAPLDFTTGDGETVVVDALNDDRHVRYAEFEGWQMVELPYGGDGGLVARYVLPPKTTIPASITFERLAELESALKPRFVHVTLPKVDLSSTANLNAAVQRAGLTAVFYDHPPALRNISTSEDLVVGDVLQQGRFIVDEDGTAAAAVTEIVVEALSAVVGPPPDVAFVADRPHLVFIVDNQVGWDVFAALVNNPA